jgi:hydroxylamine dehydrogenase
MFGPDYTHWHGTYEVAKNFYTEFIPELEELAVKGLANDDPELVAAAQHLQKTIHEVLSSAEHRWFLGEMSEEEKAERARSAAEFKQRYAE